MENFRNNPRALVFIAQLFSAGILVIYFLMLTLDARGQAFNNPIFVRPGEHVHTAHLVEKVRKIYTSQIGVRERLNNSGKEVEKYLRYVNLPKGNPWCAAFVCWVYGEVGVVNPESGWSPALFGEGRVIWRKEEQGTRSKDQGLGVERPYKSSSSLFHGRGICDQYLPGAASEWLQPGGGVGGGFCTHVVPSTGDVFGLYFPEKGRIAHVGFIDEWKDPWVITVEGNTNVLGSREGDGVYRKRRLVRVVDRVARYVN
jgi:hypothetical protein